RELSGCACLTGSAWGQLTAPTSRHRDCSNCWTARWRWRRSRAKIRMPDFPRPPIRARLKAIWRCTTTTCIRCPRRSASSGRGAVAGATITIVDDGVKRGGFGSSPFDGEGVPTRRTMVIERGVLKSYLLNTYVARKLGLATTGNASRGVTGNPGIGNGNFYVEP